MRIVNPVSLFWVALAFLFGLLIAEAIWAVILAVVVVTVFIQFCRPSVRREFGKGWRREPPYDK